jgi:hypothetical protein
LQVLPHSITIRSCIAQLFTYTLLATTATTSTNRATFGCAMSAFSFLVFLLLTESCLTTIACLVAVIIAGRAKLSTQELVLTIQLQNKTQTYTAKSVSTKNKSHIGLSGLRRGSRQSERAKGEQECSARVPYILFEFRDGIHEIDVGATHATAHTRSIPRTSSILTHILLLGLMLVLALTTATRFTLVCLGGGAHVSRARRPSFLLFFLTLLTLHARLLIRLISLLTLTLRILGVASFGFGFALHLELRDGGFGGLGGCGRCDSWRRWGWFLAADIQWAIIHGCSHTLTPLTLRTRFSRLLLLLLLIILIFTFIFTFFTSFLILLALCLSFLFSLLFLSFTIGGGALSLELFAFLGDGHDTMDVTATRCRCG